MIKNRIKVITAPIEFSFDINKTLKEDYKEWTAFDENNSTLDKENKSLYYAYVPSRPNTKWFEDFICLDDFVDSMHVSEKGFGKRLVMKIHDYLDLFRIVGNDRVYSIYFGVDSEGYNTVIDYLLKNGYTVRRLVAREEVSSVITIDGVYYWFSHDGYASCSEEGEISN